MPSTRVTGVRRPDHLFQQAREPVFLIGPRRRLSYVNLAWEELTGHRLAEVVGLECRAHGPTRGGDLDGLAGSFDPPTEAWAGQPASATTLILRPDGERLWRRLEFWPHHDREGALLFVLGLVRPADSAPVAPEAPSHRLRVELLAVRDQVARELGSDALLGRGPAYRRLLSQVAAAGASGAPTTVVGPPGSGKRTVARAIHQAGPPGGSLLLFDVPALPADSLERELHSAFRPVEGADRTVVLAEGLELPRDLQAQLAQAITAGRPRGPRVVVTTSVDPDRAFREDRLRADLYYELTPLVIHLPPLRDRRDELALLAQNFLERANLQGDRQRRGFEPSALDVLLGYDWPGNLRELQRVIEEAHGRGPTDPIRAEDLPAAIRGELGAAYLPPPARESWPLDQLLQDLERQLIEKALRRARRNKSGAARLLHISRPRLHRRIQELGIPDEFEGADPGGDRRAPAGPPDPPGSSP